MSMSRVIKFRAWDKETNSWYDNSNQNLVINLDGTLTNCWNGELMEDYTERIILLPFTGLKDKNGVEIYEGNIVRWHDVVTWDYSVTFKDGVFCISDDPTSNFYHLKEDINGKFEVIGSIYENPECLEVES